MRFLGSHISFIENRILKQVITETYKHKVVKKNDRDVVLFWVPGGWHGVLKVEAVIAASLSMRGVGVHAVICDGVFRACVQRELRFHVPLEHWAKQCGPCKALMSTILDNFRIPYSFIGDFVSEEELADLWQKTESITWENLSSLAYDSVAIGQDIIDAIIRYLKGEDFKGHEEVVREYAYSGLVVAAATVSAIERIKPSSICMSHGVYVDWGPALRLALFRGIRATKWMASYLPAHFYLGHVSDSNRTNTHTMRGATWEKCKQSELTVSQNSYLDKFLDDRYKKQNSFDISNFNSYTGNVNLLRKKYNLTDTKPVWGILSHINWDTVNNAGIVVYDTIDDWMRNTVKEIIAISGVQWLIKIHPEESWYNPKSGLENLIHQHFPSLPSHVTVIPKTDDINPFDYYEMLTGGVTICGTSGLELALLGKPVILAAEAHYAGKGFTHDALSVDSYERLLREAAVLGPLNEEQRNNARKYAYNLFIERQIPVKIINDHRRTGHKGLKLNQLHSLLKGEDPFVDFICDRMIDGKDFAMNSELVAMAQQQKS